MDVEFQAAELVRAARTRAGLSQRELARRAGTAQSVVARIEAGQTSPTVSTLGRLVEASGFELRAELVPGPVFDSHMMTDVERILRLDPEDRLLELRNLSRFESAAERV
jgi:transcriptional regulator with XRE-family HTH domain